MNISYNWLKDYVQLNFSPEEIAGIITNAGLEVESVKKYETIKGGLEGLKVGLVKSVEKHPDADKLSVTKVSIGNSADLQIVCGAPNVAPGKK
jgi:phenylalanyl-tRNA synthetase beta chain